VYCTLHCTFTVYLLSLALSLFLSLTLSLVLMKVRHSDLLAKSSRDKGAKKKYSTCTVQYHVQFQGMTEQ